jgi:hypothetical protein
MTVHSKIIDNASVQYTVLRETFLRVVSRKATPLGEGSHQEQEAASLVRVAFGKFRIWHWKRMSERSFVWRRHGPLR